MPFYTINSVQRMWTRAAWKEDEREEEGVIPSCWVQGSQVLWPPVANAKRHLEERRTPASNWLAFNLIKVKIASGW